MTTRLISILLAFAALTLGCSNRYGDSGGCGGGQLRTTCFYDAGPLPDAIVDTCNPFSQQGCAQGEKCASVVMEAEPRNLDIRCVPDGQVGEGDACSVGEPGATTGYDNCVAFNECAFGECRAVCQRTGGTVAGSCEGTAVCHTFDNRFNDLATDDIGICIPQCDPTAGIVRTGTIVTIDDSSQCDDLHCVMNLFEGTAICLPTAPGAPAHNTPCGDRCLLDSCAPGHGPFMPGGTLAQWRDETVFFANTIFGFADVCIQYCDTTLWTEVPGRGESSDFQANCPDGSECRSANGLYLNFDDPSYAPDAYGLCIPDSSGLGSCADHVLGDVAAYLTEPGDEPEPVPASNRFIPGCSSGPEVVTRIESILASDALTIDPGTLDGWSRLQP